MIELEIGGYIQKSFINGIDMDILFRNIVQIDAVNGDRIVDIQLHARFSHNILYSFRNFKDTAAIADAQFLHCRCDGKTDCFIASFWISHNQIGGHGVKTTFYTFHRSVKAS